MSATPPIVYVFDAFALMAYFNREVGWEIVQSLLREHLRHQARVLISEINWGEMYYMTAKKINLQAANQRIRQVDRLKISIEPVTHTLVKSAADFKIRSSTAKSPLSYADCFAAALAQQQNATLITGDPEFKSLETIISIRWLR
jgi:predicted nucleic acid-binding protein